MQDYTNISVLLVSEYNPRSEILSERIAKVFGKNAELNVVRDIQEIRGLDDVEPDFVFLDLANIKNPALKTIQIVSTTYQDAKIIASHIYHSRLLIDPLFDNGIDGYITYEPKISQIKEAVENVQNGVKYLPGHIGNK